MTSTRYWPCASMAVKPLKSSLDACAAGGASARAARPRNTCRMQGSRRARLGRALSSKDAPRTAFGCGSVRLRLQDLLAAIRAGLEVDVMGAAQFASLGVLDIGVLRQFIVRAAHIAARGRGFSL